MRWHLRFKKKRTTKQNKHNTGNKNQPNEVKHLVSVCASMLCTASECSIYRCHDMWTSPAKCGTTDTDKNWIAHKTLLRIKLVSLYWLKMADLKWLNGLRCFRAICIVCLLACCCFSQFCPYVMASMYRHLSSIWLPIIREDMWMILSHSKYK